jgi:hypothetical protein
MLSHFSDLWVVPELDLGVFITTNTVGGDVLTSSFASRIVAQFHAPPRTPPIGSPDLVRDATRYGGFYLSTRRAYSGLESFIGMLNGVNVSVSPDGFLLMPIAGGTQRFAPTGTPHVFRAVEGDAAVTFEMSGDRAVRILTPGAAVVRAGVLQQQSTLVASAALTVLAVLAIALRLAYWRGAPLLETPWQGRARALRALVAWLWLGSMVLFGVWVARAISDTAAAVYEWPSPLVVGASWMALVAAAGSSVLVILVPWTWRRPRGAPGWSLWRRLRFAYTAMVFVAFGALLALLGALQPWNS